MNIAIDARSLERAKTGVGRYLSNLLEYWKDNNKHRFTLYFKDNLPDISLLKGNNFTKKLLKNPFGFSSNFFFQHFLLPYHLKRDKVDFFFSPFYLKSFYCPVKSSVVLHDISYEAYPEWFNYKNRFILKTLSKLSAKSADAIFTVSNYSKNEIIKYYNINPDKITITHLAPDEGFTKIDDLEKIEAVKKKYHIDNKFIPSRRSLSTEDCDKKTRNPLQSSAERLQRGEGEEIPSKFIFCVGSIFNRRHIPEIIAAFEKIAGEYGDYQLLIIGRNHTHPFIDIKSKIKTANENLDREAIGYFDFVSEDELLALYSSCEINIYLSDYEGFGLPVIEAQFFGKPVITSYNSSLVEVGNNSVEFVENNTTEEIYKSLIKIISDESYKEDLIRRGEENIKRFDWGKCAGETMEEVESI